MSFRNSQKVSPKVVSLSFGVLVLCFVLGFWVLAWTEPSQAPPDGNVDTPLNVGSTAQSKEGGLVLNTGGAPVGLYIAKGNTALGTTTIPNETLEVDGNIKLLGTNPSYRIKNVLSPTDDNDVATKGYVDAQGSGGPGNWTCIYVEASATGGRPSATCYCSSGYKLIAGGCSHSSNELAGWIMGSKPVNNGWYCKVNRSGGANVTTLTAGCWCCQ